MTRTLCQRTLSGKSATQNAGHYVLIMELKESRRMAVGRLGNHEFSRGWYAYVGRARRNLRQRLERHYRRSKSLRWHIDYFLQHAQIQRTLVLPIQGWSECSLARKLASREGARVAVPGFGASDCRCPGHLVYFGKQPPPEDFC
jgi:sugar fermentation stimulation protein A